MDELFTFLLSEIHTIIEYFFSVYVLILMVIYLLRAFNSVFINIYHKKISNSEKNQIDQLAKSRLSIGISIIAPAYNESATIIDNIRSLLNIDYPSFEVVVVNDGSKDDSVEKVVKAFNMQKVELEPSAELKTKFVRGIYRSADKAYRRLVFIDKENGGKSDALNAGLVYARHPVIGCIDVDSILTKDALIKLARPFMQDKSVIASGSAIRIANSCEIEHGFLKKVFMPKGFFERFQVLEYLRAFLLGRMSLSVINGLMLVSGASGLFKKRLVLKVGGYKTGIVGEDIELVIRMRRHCYENKVKHKIKYIPDPVCWTEAPDNAAILKKQRNRWARGSFEAIQMHSKMLFNPKYGIMGLYSLPYWLFFELLLPVIILVGTTYTIIMASLGYVEMDWFLDILFLSYIFSVFISLVAILIEELTYRQYTKKIDLLILIGLVLLEVLVYQPMVLFWSLDGLWDKVVGKENSWGSMTRKGFAKESSY